MKRSTKPQNYFVSDFHFNHYNTWTNNAGEKCGRGIITFERTQFKTIQEHNDFIINKIKEWSQRWAEGSTLWFLGDFGDPNYIDALSPLWNQGINIKFMLGNHDKKEDIPVFEQYAEVYEYPVFLSQKLVVSHYPVAVYGDTINVHGHLHGSKLRDENHINVSINDINYQPLSEKNLLNHFGKVDKFTRRFLYEPFAADMVFTRPKEDCIYDKMGRIDLSASRLLMRLTEQKRKSEKNNPYKPYVGGFDND